MDSFSFVTASQSLLARRSGVDRANLNFANDCQEPTTSSTALRTDNVNIELLAPMMRDYVERKREFAPEKFLLLYRVGDFFETFFEDAATFAEVAGLALTAKDGGKALGQKVPMAGVPWHSMQSKCRSLLDAGISVAVCDQVEPSSVTKNGALVKREITQFITPGTLLDENLLSPTENNFLCAVVADETLSSWAIAYVDVSTGEFSGLGGSGKENLAQQICRVSPSELLVNEQDDVVIQAAELLLQSISFTGKRCTISRRKAMSFTPTTAAKKLSSRFGVESLEVLGCQDDLLLTTAAAAVVEYIQDTLEVVEGLEVPLRQFRTDVPQDYMVLDPGVIRNLEVVKTLRDGSSSRTLFWAVNRTETAMGARLLRSWLLQPSKVLAEITERLDAVDALAESTTDRDGLRLSLKKLYDIERLASKVASKRANPRDLLSLATSLENVSEVIARVDELPKTARINTILSDLGNEKVLTLAQRVANSLNEPAPLVVAAVSTESSSASESLRIFRGGVYPELDSLSAAAHVNTGWMDDFQKKERDRLGLTNLKVNRISNVGWVIRIPRSSMERIAEEKIDHFIPSGSTKTELRFRTQELTSKERKWAANRLDLAGVEAQYFYALRDEMSSQIESVRCIASSIAQLDVLLGFAIISLERNYERPNILPAQDRRFDLISGRHPVIEQTLDSSHSSFISNSITLGTAPDFMLLTGPNASGKSCVLRQVGVCQILAQIGCPLPSAAGSSVSVCDRVFARVGAVDDLSGGQSTFMVEMTETAAILSYATSESLVLLDEIGRGTSTSDGVAIAWSVSEFLAKGSSGRGIPRVIFATHYHELNMLGNAAAFSNVMNFQMELLDGGIPSFRLLKGGSWSSHGVAVAQRAGIPALVLARAQELLTRIEEPAKAIGKVLGSPTPRKTTEGKPPSPPARRSMTSTSLVAQQEAYAAGYRAALKAMTRHIAELDEESAG